MSIINLMSFAAASVQPAARFCHVFCSLDCARTGRWFHRRKLVNHTGEGLIRGVLLGVVGAFIGGYLFSLFGGTGVTGLHL